MVSAASVSEKRKQLTRRVVCSPASIMYLFRSSSAQELELLTELSFSSRVIAALLGNEDTSCKPFCLPFVYEDPIAKILGHGRDIASSPRCLLAFEEDHIGVTAFMLPPSPPPGRQVSAPVSPAIHSLVVLGNNRIVSIRILPTETGSRTSLEFVGPCLQLYR